MLAKSLSHEATIAKTNENGQADTIEEVRSGEPLVSEADSAVEATVTEQTTAKTAVVDALAYRVPCPPDGGACWGPGGQ